MAAQSQVAVLTIRALGTIVLLYFGFRLVLALWGFVRELRLRAFIRRNFPGPTPHWLYGNVRDEGIGAPGLVWDKDMAEKYRRLFVLWVGWKPLVILNHPDTVRQVLSSTTMSVKAPMYDLFKECSEGLGVSEGAIWKRHRRLVTPSFNFNILKRYVKTMNRTFDTLETKLGALAESDEPLKVHNTMTRFATDVILRCAFSYQSNCQVEESRYVEMIAILTTIVVNRTFNPLLFYDFFFRLTPSHKKWKEALRVMHGLQESVIAERRKKYQEHPIDPTTLEKSELDFLDTVLTAKDSDGTGLNDKEIRDQVSGFIFAGMDTTSSALTWLLLLLAKHPEHQARLQQEVDELFEGKDDDDVLYGDLQRLPFTTQCIKESLRLYVYVPPYRLLVEPLPLDDGRVVPAGTEIMVNQYQLHHNPDVWGDDHEEFRPSRFEKERVAARDPFAFLPFSAGHRNCIGQQFAMHEMQIATARFFRKFGVTPVKEALPVFKVVTKPVQEILLKLHPR